MVTVKVKVVIVIREVVKLVDYEAVETTLWTKKETRKKYSMKKKLKE